VIISVFDFIMLQKERKKVFNFSPQHVPSLLYSPYIVLCAYLCHTCTNLFDFDSKCTTVCPNYYRDVLLFVCGGAATFGLVVLATLAPFDIGTRRRGK
jgi:hypothetical protein